MCERAHRSGYCLEHPAVQKVSNCSDNRSIGAKSAVRKCKPAKPAVKCDNGRTYTEIMLANRAGAAGCTLVTMLEDLQDKSPLLLQVAKLNVLMR